MIDLDFNKLAIGVEKRLDEIFADDFQTRNPKIVEMSTAKSRSLASLRNIIMSLEWEVTDKNLGDLMRELSRLQQVYNKDDQRRKLLRILFLLGRHVRVYQSDTSPSVFKMLFRVYNGLVKIESEKFSDHQKTTFVNAEVKRYLSLRDYLKRKNSLIRKHAMNNLNKLGESRLSANYSNPVQKPYQLNDRNKISKKTLDGYFMELKNFFCTEIKKLRLDLHKLAILLPKEI